MRWLIASVVLAAPLVAGTGCRSDEDGEAEGDTDPVVEAPPFEPEAPRLLDPPSDEIEVPTTRVLELEFAVADIVAGFTSVVLDGESLGPLRSDSIVGQLGNDALQLRTGGAMAPGDHTLVLRTRGAEEILESREVLLRLTPGPSAGLSAEVGADPAFQADALFSTGTDAAALVVGIDTSADEASLHVVAIGEGPSWDDANAQDVPLPLLTPDEELAHTVAVQRVLGDELVGDDDRIRAVWRARPSADGLILVDTLWEAPTFAPRTILELGPELLGEAEAGVLGRPLIVGDTVVVEALLATDVEQPRPGDRRLITAHLSGAPADAGLPRVSQLFVGADVDRLGEVVDLQGFAAGASPRFSARVAGVTPAVLRADRSSGALSLGPSLANNVVAALGSVRSPPVTLLSSFATRTLFSPISGETPRTLLLQFDDRRAGGRTDLAPSAASLADLPDPSGPAVGTIIGGTAVFVVPAGVEDDAIAFVVEGPRTGIRRLAGLTCDALALSHTSVGNVEGVAAVACQRGRDVFVGQLRTTE